MSKMIRYDREMAKKADEKGWAIFGVGVRLGKGEDKEGGLVMHMPRRRADFLCQIVENIALRRDEPLSKLLAEFVPIMEQKEAEEAAKVKEAADA
jgi:hypothetical protein